jgi:hypothetical protein
MITSHSVLLTIKNVSDNGVEKIKKHIFYSKTFFILPFMRQCGKILYSRKAHRWQYGAGALPAVYLRLQAHTQNM